MKHIILLILFCSLLVLPVSARAIEAPPVPEYAEKWMPDSSKGFGEGLLNMVISVMDSLLPELQEGLRTGFGVTVVAVAVSVILIAAPERRADGNLVGCVAIAGLLLAKSHAMIRLSGNVITELSEYSKLLIPVMTAAAAAQGSFTSSSGLYIGTTGFIAFLNSILSKFLVPMVYMYLTVSIVSCALGEENLKRMKEILQKISSWFLKMLITVFLSYMSLTRVISGTVDAAALKAAKSAISTAVPVIGSTLANISESVLVGAALVKNSIGIYGIYAILAIFLVPFIRIAIQYGILKAAALICGLFDVKELSSLIEDFSHAMGLLLAMVGTLCLLLLIAMICFLHGGT